MSRKLTVVLLVLSLALGCFSGLAMAEEPVTITWYGVGAQSDHQARINEAASAYLQSKGINVNLELNILSWGDYAQVYQVMMATQEEFDLLNAEGNRLIQFGLNGGLVEITDDLLTNSLPGVKSVVSETILNALKHNGALYTIPAMHEWAQYYGFPYINMDVMEALGLEESLRAVETLDDLDPILEQVHAAYPDIVCIGMPDMETVMCAYKVDPINHASALCVGLDVMQENAVAFNYFENEGVQAVLAKAQEWYQKGYIDSDTTRTTSNLIAQGQIFSQIGRFKPGTGSQSTNVYARYTDMAWDEDAAPLLTMKDAPGGWGTGISKTSKNPELAMQVLDLAYTDPDFLNILVFGEKDVDYTLNDEGYLTYIEGGYANDVAVSRTWEFGNQPMTYVTTSYVDLGLANIWELQEEFNNSAVAVESAGFYFDTTDVDIEVAAIANVYDEYAPMLWRGAVENLEETLAEFNQKLYDNGLQTVIDEVNRQYAEFLANK